MRAFGYRLPVIRATKLDRLCRAAGRPEEREEAIFESGFVLVKLD